MDCHLVDLNLLSETFGGAKIWYIEIKLTDGTKYLPSYLESSGWF